MEIGNYAFEERKSLRELKSDRFGMEIQLQISQMGIS